MSRSPSSSTKYVLVVVTAKGCGSCAKFKNDWPNIKPYLEGKVRIVEIEQPTISVEYSSRYPRNLKDYCNWFPTLVLFRASDWEAKNLAWGDVFNGIVTGGKAYLKQGSRVTLNANNLVNWLNSYGL